MVKMVMEYSCLVMRSGSSRHIEILTNDPRTESPNNFRAIQGSEGQRNI